MSERGTWRRERLLSIMEGRGLSAIVLRRPPNFAWYTGGGDNRVDLSAPEGVADLVITPQSEYILTNTIEGRRLREEGPQGLVVVEYPWYDDPSPALRRLTGNGPLGSDGTMPDTTDLSAEIGLLRRVLDDQAIALYRQVGADTVAAMTEAADFIQPGMTENEAAAALFAAVRRRGMYAALVMAAADDRILHYRHAITHGDRISKRLMLVVCAERGGLYANFTRFLQFEDMDADLTRRFAACNIILRRMREEATIPGRTLADAFAECRRFYADEGYPDEWRLHHQGGMTGYATREVVATSHTLDAIETGQAFAWNPSITGAKAEETFILTPTGPEVVAGQQT